MSKVPIKLIAESFVGPSCLNDKSFDLETELDLAGVLRNPKNLKFMAKQDKLSVLAVHRLLQKHSLTKEILNKRTGIYFCVGALPFEDNELNNLAVKSELNGNFDMQKFSTETFTTINPLLTFKCLPNMSIFHVSNNFEIYETYFITYPGQFQWAQALKRAVDDLQAHKIDYAIVGAVADQRNPLVKYYIHKLGGREIELLDVAGMWLLTNNQSINSQFEIGDLSLQYKKINYFSDYKISNEGFFYLGPVDDIYYFYTNKNKFEQNKSVELNFGEGCYSYQIQIKNKEWQ